MGTIYGLVDPFTKHLRYIGQTIQPLQNRIRYHKYIAKSKRSRNYLYNWLNTLVDRDTFAEVLIIEENCEDLNFWEVFYIQYFRGLGCPLTNLSPGGNARGGFKHTEEHKKRMSKMFKGRKPWNTGLKLTPEQKKNRKISENFRNLSKESMEKRVRNQCRTKALKSKVPDSTIRYIRANVHKYKQIELAEMLGLRPDYISDVVNFKIRKYA